MNLDFLRPLYQRPGPWASVYLDASHDTHDAAKAIGLRWASLRERLAADGADDATLDAIATAVDADIGEPGAHGLAVFATDGEVALTETLPHPPRRELGRVSTLPHAMPLVAELGEQVSWLQVVVDRTGAGLTALHAGSAPRRSTVEGHEHYHLRKSKPGGWSSPRYQRAAEENWDRNAADVAEVVTLLATKTDVDVIVLAGDVRARQLLRDRLPDTVLARVVDTDAGSRAPGADEGPLDEATAAAVAEVAARETAAVVDRFNEDRGRHSVTGLTQVVDALRQAKVDTLVLADRPESTATLWIGPEAAQLGLSEEDVLAEGTEEPVRVRADSAILRALVMTGARLEFVEGDQAAAMTNGIGALLRYPR